MKRTKICLLLLILSCSVISLFAQSYSPQEVKKILTSYEWKLIRLEKNNVRQSMPEAYKGMKMVFTSKYVYDLTPSNTEAIQLNSYSLENGRLVMGDKIENGRLVYTLKQTDKYIFTFYNPDYDESNVYIFEQGDRITGDGMPKTKYEIVKEEFSYNSTPKEALPIIKSINDRIREAMGNLRFYTLNEVKVTIDDVSFTPSEFGVQVMGKFTNSKSGLSTTWTYEIIPELISYVKQMSLAEESPVGVLNIHMESPIAYTTSYDKTNGFIEQFLDNAYINFLKIDPNAYKSLEADINRLKEVYEHNREERLFLLKSFMDTDKKFWISGNGSSSTYQLEEVQASGGTLRFTYYLQKISTSGDTKEYYTTIVPLKDIDELVIDKSKSRPATIQLVAGKKGFATFKQFKGEKYISTSSVSSIPVFIDVTKDERLNRVVELLKTHTRELGGKKL